MNKTRTKILAVMIAIIISLLLVGAFSDMAISDRLYEGDSSILDMLGGFFGKLPAFLLLAFGFAILMGYIKTNADAYKKSHRILLYIAYSLFILVAYVLAFYSAFEELTSKAKYIGLMLGLIAMCITVLAVFKTNMSHGEELKKWALLTILAVGIIMILTIAIKEVWGRQRYVDIITNGAAYSPWYIPKGFTGGHSFPSGHTALYGAIFMVLPLFDILGYKGKGVATALIIVTQILIGLFRIIGGHHFLSDITMSIAISFLTCFIVIVAGYKSDYRNKVLGEKNIFRRI